MAEKQINYDEKMVRTMLEMYRDLGNEGIDEIAEKLGRSRRSVISKLSSMKVYETPKVKPRVKAVEGPSKKELERAIAATGVLDPEGLGAATKAALGRVLELAQRVRDLEQGVEQETEDEDE